MDNPEWTRIRQSDPSANRRTRMEHLSRASDFRLPNLVEKVACTFKHLHDSTINLVSKDEEHDSMSRTLFRGFLTLSILTVLSLYLSFRTIFSFNTEPASPEDYLRGPNKHHGQSDALKYNTTRFTPPFRAAGRHIIDTKGHHVKLFSVNWYGASDGGFVVGGLDRRHRKDIAETIKALGFNSVRLPYADELVLRNPELVPELLSANKDLWGSSALTVFAAIVEALTSAGLYVIINNHITQARWCCDANPCDGTWKNDYLGPFCRIRQTEKSWIQNLETIMRPHIDDQYVIGVDLRNEPRDITDKYLWGSWAAAAEKAAARLHNMQPNWLMFVEGISSANDISGARSRPVKLSIPQRLVYSSHIYGWSGWGSMSPFWKRPYDSFAAEMEHNWAWLVRENIAPVWIGEIGAPEIPNKGDLHYWDNLIRYLKELDEDYNNEVVGLAYWALNPRKWTNYEVEGYGLLEDDWETPRWDYRMIDMLDIISKNESSVDHELR